MDGNVEVSHLPGPAPTVVFEAGLGAHKESWTAVFREIARTNAVFAYDRPGIGRSTSTGRPRDGTAIVEELRTLLRGRGLKPPYVLVGHSAGGLYMQLYARLHPEEVAGLVLVDSTHPTQFEGEGSLANRGALAWGIMALAGGIGPIRPEFDALPQTGAEVLAAPPLSARIATVILLARNDGGGPAAAFDKAKRADFARLYPTAQIRWIDSSHNIPGEKPDAVVEAIRWVLAQPR
ncbi:MAG: alpha/beta fold hydrolase [Reyranella sp.]|nr:MAG: alpha/beta fold hydrolase [Reyranella sp.]TBR27340.1 MAG: alpha/beta fold hydrolase [Reyranella sp.]